MAKPSSVVIVGGGHNGLIAAAYLARAGYKVTLLERLTVLGGAAVSALAFPGVEARLSRYSYLVSLLPKRIIKDLDLDIRFARRRYSSYTPDPGGSNGLLVDNQDPVATRSSFRSIGAHSDADAWTQFYQRTRRIAETVFPSLCEPLLSRDEQKRMLGDDTLWDQFIEQPLGEVIESSFSSDLVRGVVLTDGLIGTFTEAKAKNLAANRCFLYHVIGNGTGDWDVPIGGMGSVTSAMSTSARKSGATLITGAEVTSVDPDGEVTYLHNETQHSIRADYILANVSSTELDRLIGVNHGLENEVNGAQAKVNLMLRRLPKLKDSSLDPAAAFGGTFHINELYSQLQSAYDQAASGSIPNPVPAEIYCHSLADSSILSPELQASGAQTLTVFALHIPNHLVTESNNNQFRSQIEAAVLSSLDSVLGESIRDVIMTDENGDPCVETKTTLDLEHALRLPGGNIFQQPLDWPFVEDAEDLTSPAKKWGVETKWDRVLFCGSSAKRGGAVSGIGGQNAAMAILEAD